jgi:hypothetical protein
MIVKKEVTGEIISFRWKTRFKVIVISHVRNVAPLVKLSVLDGRLDLK